MDLVIGLLAAFAGVALLGYGVVLRLGASPRARDWVHLGEGGARTSLLMIPGGGAFLLAFGAIRWDGDSPVTAVVVALCLPLIGLLLPGGLQLRVPLWFVPSWARDSVGRRRDAERRGRRRARAARGRRAAP